MEMKTSVSFFCLVFVFLLVNGDFLDMTYKFEQNSTVYWPGTKEFKFENEVRGYYDTPNGKQIWAEKEEYTAGTHGGTHMDAPSHFGDSTGKQWTVEEVPVSRLVGPLRIIDVTAGAAQNRDYSVTVSDIAAHEKEHGRIPRGAIVVMKSGWGSKWPNKKSYLGEQYSEMKLTFPGFSKEAADWLTSNREIYGVGVDTPSLDHGSSPDYPAHLIFFKNNIYGLENVANVDQAPEAGATLMALPMKSAGGSGAPCRVVAVWGPEKGVISGATVGTEFSILTFLSLHLVSVCLNF